MAEEPRLSLKAHSAGQILLGKDPSIVVTVAALYYLLRNALTGNHAEQDRQEIERVRRSFDGMHWMVGPDGMRALGIETTAAAPT